jgi:hypothetical protein
VRPPKDKACSSAAGMCRGSLRRALLGGIAVLPLAATVVLPTQAAWAASVGQTIATDTPVTIGNGCVPMI